MSIAKEFQPEYIIDKKGRKKAVIVSFAEYENLLEDIADLAVLAERREENTVTHEQLLNDLKADGKI